MKKIKYIYAGFDSETPLILSSDSGFELVASALNPLFLAKTLNPFNLIFKTIYFLRERESLRWLESFLCSIWSFFNIFSSSVFKSNKNLLNFLSKNKVSILNFKNINLVEDYVKENEIDLIIVNAWELIPEKIIKAPKYGAVNVHPSRLPKYRGALPTLWALKNKDKKTAVTYLILNKAVDKGNILSQHELLIEPNDNAVDLEYKIREILKKTLVRDIKSYIKGEIIPCSQNESEASKTAKYFDYLQINWQRELGSEIYNKILLYPFIEPGLYCYLFLKNKKIFIRGAEFIPGEKNSSGKKVGEFDIKYPHILFQANDGIIKIKMFRDLSVKNSLNLLFNL